MKVLIVGCGAVGQVYGLALQNAGVTLGLLDQPAVVEKLAYARQQNGLSLFQVSYRHRKDPLVNWLRDYQVIINEVESQSFAPDQIWFTTPSQAYYSDWFRNFLQHVPSKRVVCFTPEGKRPEFFPDEMSERIVFGGTTFMAWQGDLGGYGDKLAGIYYWRPPLGIPLAGTQAACREVAQLLKEAGFRAMVGNPGSHSQASMTAIMTTFTAGLELSGWSLSAFRRSQWLRRAAAAGGEAILGQLSKAGIFTRGWLRNPILTASFFLVALLLPVLFPFDVQKYLEFHYTKTREQTMVLLNVFLKDSLRCGVPVTNIQLLLAGLEDRKPYL
jgi:hypothetical protein